MTKTYFTEEGVMVSGESLDHLRETMTDETAHITIQQQTTVRGPLSHPVSCGGSDEPV